MLKGLPQNVLNKLRAIFNSVHKKTGSDNTARRAMLSILGKAYRKVKGSWQKIRTNEVKDEFGLVWNEAPGWSDIPDIPWEIDEATRIAQKPVVFTREGVQKEGLKLRGELKKALSSFEYVPVIYGAHPSEMLYDLENGTYLGWLDEVEYVEEGQPRLKGTVNVDLSDPGIPDHLKEAIMDNTLGRGVSPGFFGVWNESMGEWNGTPYTSIERDIVGQHLVVGTPKPANTPQQGVGLGLDTVNGEIPDDKLEEMRRNEMESAHKIQQEKIEEQATQIEKLTKQLETATTKLNEAGKNLEALGELGSLDDLKRQMEELKALKDAKETAEEVAQEALVKEVVGKLGGEAEEYADYSLQQLEALKKRLDETKVPPTTDQRLKDLSTPRQEGETEEPISSIEPSIEFTVGQLTGKSQEIGAAPAEEKE